MMKIEGFYTSNPNRRSYDSKKGQALVAEATTSSKKEAGARKHRNTFNEVMKSLYMTPGYIQEMGKFATSIIVKGKLSSPNIEEIKEFDTRVSLIFDGYTEMILRTHFRDAAYGCFKWELHEVASLFNGYKSQALREAEEAKKQGKWAERRAFFKLANFCESRLNIRCMWLLLNSIIEDIFTMEDLCLDGFQAILASQYAKSFDSFREEEKKKMELRAEMARAKRVKK